MDPQHPTTNNGPMHSKENESGQPLIHRPVPVVLVTSEAAINSLKDVFPDLSLFVTTKLPYPDAPCMEYVPASTPKMAEIRVNIPYM